ncbi:YceD family protein [Brevibacillus laterosporus]|uniref:YceD family protein n=1 Tax=Brevibacillus laterosporus TaxID=1465 RepID=UPI0003611904|nr:DUF177 domain-containing protein [Brevibacillus laterosporus]ATO48001.1 DNA-binding protein [Brevibacillus laterosporus DSM 25]AYB37228.1 DUF177 domain-containing protein [Brevibacillus laterosporus]MBG9773655.1 DNA-binding protein [Brevibacillus laterosporus]MBG9788151.1 DNA-binding protein [Brevibacillus laterosporus]MBG9800009.1 DNA-binding protein [Brevibacillus laterosporus]
MNIKLIELHHRKGEPLPFQTNLDSQDLKKRHQEIRDLSPVSVTGEAVELGGLIYIKGEIQAEAKFVCARCLTPYTEQLSIPFSETFAPNTSDIEFDEDSDIHQVTGEEIELDPFLEEDFLLSISAFPLCSKDCEGLCSNCGINRNEQSCNCSTERIDPRLEALKKFFIQAEE